MSIQQRNLQKNNAKIDVTGKVHPRPYPPRPSANQHLEKKPHEMNDDATPGRDHEIENKTAE